MDLNDSKQVCGICTNWGGKRECISGVVKVKPSVKGQCSILNKPKPPHGGCGKWEKWDECFSK